MIRMSLSGPKVLTRLAIAAGLLTVVTMMSCKKVKTEQEPRPSATMKTMSGSQRLTINMEEVYAALPLQTLYNFRQKLSFYPERAEWFYTDEYLQVRIPTTRSNNDFVYAIKRYDKPEVTSLFVVHFTPDAGANEKEFSGEQRWLNLQNNRVYALYYKQNKVVAHITPSAPVAPVNWQRTMMARGAFFINAAGSMELRDPSTYSGNYVPMSDDDEGSGVELPNDRDLINDQFGAGNVSVDKLTGDMYISVPPTPNAVIDDGEPGSNYDQGNGLDWGWAPQPGGGGSGPVRPPFNPPIIEPEMPLAMNGHNVQQAGLNGSSLAAHWYDPTSLAVALVAATLHLNTTQIAWLNQHEDIAEDIRDYLLTYVPGLTPVQKEERARRHLQMMMTDPAYLTFVNNYDQNHTGMWWLNEDWLELRGGIEFGNWAIQYLIDHPNITINYILTNKTDFADQLGEVDDYVDGGYDNTIIPNTDPNLPWPAISPVIPINQFVGWSYPGVRENCMDYCRKQLQVVGYRISSYGATGQTFQIYTTQNGVNNNMLIQGISYIKYALSNGIPVVVGVDDQPGSPNPTDNSTDHFVVIVGMGTNSTGKYLQFYDNASGDVSQGANSLNLLYYNPTTGLISGTSQTIYGQAKGLYKLTMIRKSKSL